MISSRSNYPVKFILLLVTVAIFTQGCSQKKQVSGKDVMPRNVLVEVLTEMYLMDGITNDMRYYRKFNPVDSIDLYGSILEKHGIDHKIFKSTIEAYSKYPTLLDEVYDEVLMQLNLMLEKEEDFKEEDSTGPSKPGFKKPNQK